MSTQERKREPIPNDEWKRIKAPIEQGGYIASIVIAVPPLGEETQYGGDFSYDERARSELERYLKIALKHLQELNKHHPARQVSK